MEGGRTNTPAKAETKVGEASKEVEMALRDEARAVDCEGARVGVAVPKKEEIMAGTSMLSAFAAVEERAMIESRVGVVNFIAGDYENRFSGWK